jgi:hypothetical protein
VLSQRFVFRSAVVAVLVCCLALVGCGGGGKVTKENHAKLKTGMTEAEVVAVMGTPTKKTEADPAAAVPGGLMPPGVGDMAKTTVLTWEEGGKSIVVTLMGGKVFVIAPFTP